MKKWYRHIIKDENIAYLAMWALLFCAPLLTMLIRYSTCNITAIDWHGIWHVEETLGFYLLIFLIHNFLLAPLLVYKQKSKRYFVITTLLTIVFFIGQFTIREDRPHDRRRHEPDTEMRMPQRMIEDMPQFRRGNKSGFKHNKHMRKGDWPMVGPKELINTMAMVFMMGMNLAIKLYFKSEKDKNRMRELEKENLKQRLNYLRYQINPHFFMNTLNNIHALVDIDPEKAKEAIVELSKLMRHILYGGDKTLIPLSEEISFVENYIKLTRLRFADMVSIETSFDGITTNKCVAPLVLATFAENAFKHGISYKAESRIEIAIRCHDDRYVLFVCKNPLIKGDKAKKGKEGGIGLDNVRKRLDLIYKGRYAMDIKQQDNTYKVRLLLPLISDTATITNTITNKNRVEKSYD